MRMTSFHTSPLNREAMTLTAVERTALVMQQFACACTYPFLSSTQSSEILCCFRNDVSKQLKHYTTH